MRATLNDSLRSISSISRPLGTLSYAAFEVQYGLCTLFLVSTAALYLKRALSVPFLVEIPFVIFELVFLSYALIES